MQQNLALKDPFVQDPEKRCEEKKQLLKELQDTIRDFRGMESDIPTTHDYWNKLNHFRTL